MPLKRKLTPMRKRPVSPARRHVVFTLAGAWYAIDAAHVKHFFPGWESHDERAAFLGHEYRVIDLRAAFGLPLSHEPGRLILVVEIGGKSAGLLVDGLVSLALIDPASVVALPTVFDGAERDWFDGVVRLDERVTIVMRAAGVLASAGRWSPLTAVQA
jgi:purine-binding chemotaxis protein CheW